MELPVNSPGPGSCTCEQGRRLESGEGAAGELRLWGGPVTRGAFSVIAATNSLRQRPHIFSKRAHRYIPPFTMKGLEPKGWLPCWEIKPQAFYRRHVSGVTTVLSFSNFSLTTSLTDWKTKRTSGKTDSWMAHFKIKFRTWSEKASWGFNLIGA